MVSTAGNNTSSALTTKIGRNMKMLANDFANDDHYINLAANFPTIEPETIINMLNGNGLN